MNLVETLNKRRDTRHFLTDSIDHNIVEDAIKFAANAPSVGQLKPTRFILIESIEGKTKVKKNFIETNKQAIEKAKSANKNIEYESLKLEGILESPVGMIICYDVDVLKNFTIGTITKPNEMLIASTSCAIHTLWLYLTSKDLSLGWVSILNFELLKSDFDIPESWQPLGYFCIGKPATDYEKMPMLTLNNWESFHRGYVISKK